MVVQEKERSRKGNESRSQETCSTEHCAKQSAACGNGARCVGHRNALHPPSQRTASSDQQSSFTMGKPMTIWLHHQGRDEEDADDARRKPMTIWFHHPTTFGRMLFPCRLKPVRPTICKQAPPGQTCSSIFAKRSQKPVQDHHSSKSLLRISPRRPPQEPIQ